MKRYVAPLDGLRAVAALLVIGTHTGFVPDGYVGVDIFFALSGFLITSILLRERSEGRWSLKRFYVRRARRLYPALIFMLVLTLPFGAMLCGGGIGHYAAAAILSGAYLSDFVAAANLQWLGGLVHTWSLAVEEQFYLVWPIVLAMLMRRGKRRAALVTIAFAVIAVVGVNLGSSRMEYLPFARGGVLLFGCLLAMALEHRDIAYPTLVAGMSALALLLVVLLGAPAGDPGAALATTVAGLAATGIIAGVVNGGLVARALSFKPLRWLGQRSYGIYLWHVPITYALVGEDLMPKHGSLQTLVPVLLGSVILGALSFRFVESRFRESFKTREELAPPRLEGKSIMGTAGFEPATSRV